MEMDFSHWFFYVPAIIGVVFLIIIFIETKTIKKLKQEIFFHKKIIESKAKNHTSGNRKKIFDKGLILSFDASGNITSVNDAFSEFLGFEKQDLIGQKLVGNLIPEKDSRGNNMTNIVQHFVENPKLYIDVETEIMTKKKERRWVSWTNRAIYDESGNVLSFTGVGFDITARKLLEKELEEVSSADVITGVYNKPTFMDVGNKELMRAIRYNRDLSVLILVIHRNANFQGEKFNDVFLQHAVDVCKTLIRDCDYIGRIGDNEFALLLPETPISNAHTLVKRIENKVSAISQEETTTFIIESMGTAGRQAGDESIDKLIIRAFKSFNEN